MCNTSQYNAISKVKLDTTTAGLELKNIYIIFDTGLR